MAPVAADRRAPTTLALVAAAFALALTELGCAGVPREAAERAARYRGAARDVATWLENVAVETEHGVAWPRVPEASTAEGGVSEPGFDHSLYSGSCGPVLFFARMAAGARDEEDARRGKWLELARRGADELIAGLPEKPEGEAAGLYSGVAGIGFTLFEIGRATGDAKYLDAARSCVDRLHRGARVSGAGIDWSDTTDVIAGGAGIGLFLLYMFEEDGDFVALDLAERAGRRLLELSQREVVGRSWRMDPTFPRVMPNFSHGTAGVACFLARLHGVTGEREFLDAALDGASHLLSIADTTGGGCRIHHHTPGGTDLHYLGWCHGPPGTARLFFELHRSEPTPDQREIFTGGTRFGSERDAAIELSRARHAAAVLGGAASVRDSGLPEQRLPGFWNNVSQCCGSAGVVEFFLDLAGEVEGLTEGAMLAQFLLSEDGSAFEIGNEMRESCVSFARRVADDLIARGTRDERGLRFVQAEHRVRPELLEAQTGYMQGASGIGLALLRLAQFEEAGGDEPSRLRLPDSPFGARTWMTWPLGGPFGGFTDARSRTQPR